MLGCPPDFEWSAPRWLNALREFGTVRLRGVPMDSDNRTLLDVARRLGPISARALARDPRLLEHDGVQRIQALADGVLDQYGKPLRSADNSRFALHTDESFYIQPARWVLLHCWCPAASGGDTLLVDSRAALATADRTTRIAFEQFRLPFPCGDMTTFDARGRARFNPGEVAALLADSKSFHSHQAREWLQRFEAAFNRSVLRLALGVGDLLVIENWRVLHGREAFEPQSARLLKRVRVQDPDVRTEQANG